MWAIIPQAEMETWFCEISDDNLMVTEAFEFVKSSVCETVIIMTICQ